MTVAYKEALVELLEILKYTDQEDVNKIPKSLVDKCLTTQAPIQNRTCSFPAYGSS